MVEPAVSAVVESIKDLAVQETALLCGVIGEAGFLKDELQRLQGFLKDADSKRRSRSESADVWVSQIRDATYEAENVLEEVDYMEKRNRLKNGFIGAISRYARLPSDLLALHKVGNEIQRIRRKVREISDSAVRLKILDKSNTELDKGHAEDESLEDQSRVVQNFEGVTVVGFEDEQKEITGKLIENENRLSAVCIVVDLSKFTLLDKLPESRVFPQGLRKISLTADAIKEDPMPILEKLPCLVELLLTGYRGRTMFCSAGGFPRLQELELLYFATEAWMMEVGAMPMLSMMTLYYFLNMKKLPEGLLHLPSLKQLSLHVPSLNAEEDVTWKILIGKGCKVGA
nr:unnamed protein product [Digitaria exilis]